MKKLLYLIPAFLLFAITPLFAARQTLVPVEGSVTDNSGNPLGFATVAR